MRELCKLSQLFACLPIFLKQPVHCAPRPIQSAALDYTRARVALAESSSNCSSPRSPFSCVPTAFATDRNPPGRPSVSLAIQRPFNGDLYHCNHQVSHSVAISSVPPNIWKGLNLQISAIQHSRKPFYAAEPVAEVARW